MKKLAILAIMPVLMLVGACASDIGANQHSSASVGSASRTVMGTVVSVRQVQVRDDDNTVGTLAGGAAGGIAGAQIGRGSRATALGAVGGALAGAAVGNMAQRTLTNQAGFEYVVRLDNGEMVTVVQGADVLMAVGQRVMVVFGTGNTRSRVIPA